MVDMRSTRTTQTKGDTMTYDRACELLGFTTPKTPEENARQAESVLRTMGRGVALRYHVACSVLIEAANTTN